MTNTQQQQLAGGCSAPTVKDTSLTAVPPPVGFRLAVHIISYESLMLTTEAACRYQLYAGAAEGAMAAGRQAVRPAGSDVPRLARAERVGCMHA